MQTVCLLVCILAPAGLQLITRGLDCAVSVWRYRLQNDYSTLTLRSKPSVAGLKAEFCAGLLIIKGIITYASPGSSRNLAFILLWFVLTPC